MGNPSKIVEVNTWSTSFLQDGQGRESGDKVRKAGGLDRFPSPLSLPRPPTTKSSEFPEITNVTFFGIYLNENISLCCILQVEVYETFSFIKGELYVLYVLYALYVLILSSR